MKLAATAREFVSRPFHGRRNIESIGAQWQPKVEKLPTQCCFTAPNQGCCVHEPSTSLHRSTRSLHFTRLVGNMGLLCVKCRLQLVHKRSKQTTPMTSTITTTTTMLMMKNSTTRKQRRKLREILKLHTHWLRCVIKHWNHRSLEYYSRIISAYTHPNGMEKKEHKRNNRKKNEYTKKPANADSRGCAVVVVVFVVVVARKNLKYASQLGRFIRKTKTIFYQAKNLNFAFFKMNVHFIYIYIIINMYTGIRRDTTPSI